METLESILYRWKPEAIDEMSSHLKRMSAVTENAKDALNNHPVFSGWEGEAGERAKNLKNMFSKDLDSHSESSLTAAYKIDQVGSEMRSIKSQAQQIIDEAPHKDVIVDLATGVVSPANKAGIEHVAEMQDRVNQVIGKSNQIQARFMSHETKMTDLNPSFITDGCLTWKNPDGSCAGAQNERLAENSFGCAFELGGIFGGATLIFRLAKEAGGLIFFLRNLINAKGAGIGSLAGYGAYKLFKELENDLLPACSYILRYNGIIKDDVYPNKPLPPPLPSPPPPPPPPGTNKA